MKAPFGTKHKLVLGILLVGLVIGFIVFMPMVRVLIIGHRTLLLSRTDYHDLLAAGREILRQVPIPNGDPGEFAIVPIPKGVRIPKIVRSLAPTGWDACSWGYLTIEMGHPMDHFGVRIYPEGFQDPQHGFFNYGDRKLLDGLWYYDENYRLGSGYAEEIEKLIQRNPNAQ